MAIPKAIRFEVLRRDAFTCQYCGRKPPEVALHVDHVVPRCVGGPNVRWNLMAACRDCNLGKGASPLHPIAASRFLTLTTLAERFSADPHQEFDAHLAAFLIDEALLAGITHDLLPPSARLVHSWHYWYQMMRGAIADERACHPLLPAVVGQVS